MFAAQRLLITEESFLLIEGKLQRVAGVMPVKAEPIARLEQAAFPGPRSYDFH